jgi:hypothetical protein
MNFLRQVEVLEKAGETGSFAEIRLHMTFPILSLGSMLLLCLHAFSAEHHLPQLKDWNSATAVARAFSIGARESEAVSNLKEKIDKKIVAELKDACSCRGMRQFTRGHQQGLVQHWLVIRIFGTCSLECRTDERW